MTTKESIPELVQNLPDDVTWDDVLYQLFLRRKIEEAFVSMKLAKH